MKVGPKIVDDGLVFCVDAANHLTRSGSNGSAKDLINGTEGAFLNGAGFDNRKSGVIALDGSNDVLSFSTDVKTAECTIICWAKSNVTTKAGHGDMLYNMGSVNQGPDLWFSYSKILWNTWDGGGNPICDMPDSVHEGRDNCYTLVCDTSEQLATLYINGQEAGTALHSARQQTRMTNNNTLTLGSGRSDQGGSYPWLGYIGMFQIYNRALTAEEVLQNYEATKQRFL